jgi:hypothetical protein
MRLQTGEQIDRGRGPRPGRCSRSNDRAASRRQNLPPGFICDALETDWLAGAAGFEPLHLEIRSAEFHPASTDVCRKRGSIRDAQIRVLPSGLRVLANSDSNMQRFECRRPSQRVRWCRDMYCRQGSDRCPPARAVQVARTTGARQAGVDSVVPVSRLWLSSSHLDGIACLPRWMHPPTMA